MNKTLLAWGIASLGICSCNDKNNRDVIISDQNAQPQTSPCIIEVPCNEPELEIAGADNRRKFYDFCDSTVTITWSSVGYIRSTVKDMEIRSLTDVRGSERNEMETAYRKYKLSNNR